MSGLRVAYAFSALHALVAGGHPLPGCQCSSSHVIQSSCFADGYVSSCAARMQHSKLATSIGKSILGCPSLVLLNRSLSAGTWHGRFLRKVAIVLGPSGPSNRVAQPEYCSHLAFACTLGSATFRWKNCTVMPVESYPIGRIIDKRCC